VHGGADDPGSKLTDIWGRRGMLTPSVNIVQSSFPEQKQGEISGLSRSVSNLGSSLGSAIAGTILVSDLGSGNKSYVLAMIVLAALALVGLAAAALLPANPARQPDAPVEPTAAHAVDLGVEHG
jgi:predicted MFS family arabinose efflux permease